METASWTVAPSAAVRTPRAVVATPRPFPGLYGLHVPARPPDGRLPGPCVLCPGQGRYRELPCSGRQRERQDRWPEYP